MPTERRAPGLSKLGAFAAAERRRIAFPVPGTSAICCSRAVNSARGSVSQAGRTKITTNIIIHATTGVKIFCIIRPSVTCLLGPPLERSPSVFGAEPAFEGERFTKLACPLLALPKACAGGDSNINSVKISLRVSNGFLRPILLKKSVSNLRLAGPAIQRPSIASR